jgi:hypothetical protein
MLCNFQHPPEAEARFFIASDHDRCDCRTVVHLGKHARPDSGLRARPTYILRQAARPSYSYSSPSFS